MSCSALTLTMTVPVRRQHAMKRPLVCLEPSGNTTSSTSMSYVRLAREPGGRARRASVAPAGWLSTTRELSRLLEDPLHSLKRDLLSLRDRRAPGCFRPRSVYGSAALV